MGKCREGGRGEREMERTSEKDNILAASQVGPWRVLIQINLFIKLSLSPWASTLEVSDKNTTACPTQAMGNAIGSVAQGCMECFGEKEKPHKGAGMVSVAIRLQHARRLHTCTQDATSCILANASPAGSSHARKTHEHAQV